MEGFQKKRAQIVPLAYGRVLEIGIGSGLNFDFYNFDIVDEAPRGKSMTEHTFTFDNDKYLLACFILDGFIQTE